MPSDPSIQFLRTLAALTYDLTLSQALRILDAAEALNAQKNTPDLQTHAGRVAFARATEAIMQHLPDYKIRAIKELRTLTGCGLKEAKDALDEIQPTPSRALAPSRSF